MTREEMINELVTLQAYHKSMGGNRFAHALKKAIAILQAEPCDDVISRSAAIEAFELSNGPEFEFKLRSIPSASCNRQIGHWVYDENGQDWQIGAWVCSECKQKNDMIPALIQSSEGSITHEKINPYVFAGSQYCPSCGAKMERPED